MKRRAGHWSLESAARALFNAKSIEGESEEERERESARERSRRVTLPRVKFMERALPAWWDEPMTKGSRFKEVSENEWRRVVAELNGTSFRRPPKRKRGGQRKNASIAAAVSESQKGKGGNHSVVANRASEGRQAG